MANPSEKSPQIEKALESAFGRTSAIEGDKCIICGKSATEFRDALSRKEYSISGLCQEYQDEVFCEYSDE